MSTASRVASGLHKAVAFSLFGASLVGSGALLVTFGQSMVRRIAVRHRIPRVVQNVQQSIFQKRRIHMCLPKTSARNRFDLNI